MAEIKMRAAGNACENSFDKLSLYFQIKLYEKEITCPEIIEFYQRLEEIMGKRHEICVGMGNAYYNVHNLLMAEKEFLRAL